MPKWVLYAVIAFNLAFIFFGHGLGIANRTTNFLSMGLLVIAFIIYMFAKRDVK